MEIIKVKCLNCNEITSVMKDLLIPYSGKTVSIKCSNLKCGLPMKVQVPALENSLEIKVPELVPDLPPTQIIVDKTTKTSGVAIKILKNEKTEAQFFYLKEGKNTLGRLSRNSDEFLPDIPICSNDRKISRKHCEIFLEKKQSGFEAILKDLKSTNGTFIIGSEKALAPEDEIYLNNGDIFTIGETRIQIEFS